MSINTQFIQHADSVYKRYKKTQLAALSGKRPDPDDLSKQMAFLLITPESKIHYKSVKQGDIDVMEFSGRDPKLDYDDEILEIYSEREDKVFRALNKKLIESGLLVETNESREDLHTENALTDHDIDVIARSKTPLAFNAHLKKITSLATLDRIKSRLLELDRPVSFTKAVESHASVITGVA